MMPGSVEHRDNFTKHKLHNGSPLPVLKDLLPLTSLVRLSSGLQVFVSWMLLTSLSRTVAWIAKAGMRMGS